MRRRPATDPATCDEEMPAVVPTGPVRAKSAAPSPFERLSDENPAPQTNPTESLDAALEEGGLTVTRPERSMVRTLQQLVVRASKTAARRSRARAGACCVPTTVNSHEQGVRAKGRPGRATVTPGSARSGADTKSLL